MKVQGNDASANVKQMMAATQNNQPKAAKGNDADGDNDKAREASESRKSDTKGGNVNATV